MLGEVTIKLADAFRQKPTQAPDQLVLCFMPPKLVAYGIGNSGLDHSRAQGNVAGFDRLVAKQRRETAGQILQRGPARALDGLLDLARIERIIEQVVFDDLQLPEVKIDPEAGDRRRFVQACADISLFEVLAEITNQTVFARPGKFGRIQDGFALALGQSLRTCGKQQFLRLAQRIGQDKRQTLTGNLATLAQFRGQGSPGCLRGGIRTASALWRFACKSHDTPSLLPACSRETLPQANWPEASVQEVSAGQRARRETRKVDAGTAPLLPGNPAVMGCKPFRPVTLRPHLSMGLPFAGQQ